MKYTSVSAALEALRAVESKLSAYHHAMGVLFLDAATAAPKGSAQGRGQTMAMLSETVYALNADPENEALLSYLEAHLQELDPVDRRKVELFRKSYNQISKIPPQEYIEYDVLLNDAQAVWEQAKNTDDFALFAPYLEKIVGFNQKFAGYYNPSLPPYDALLNEYEEGLTVETLDRFFAQLREVLVPLLAKVTAAEPIDDSFLHQLYPMEQQHQLSDYIMSVLGIDRNYCAIAESEHPFTSGFHNKDVRITTHYYEQEPVFSLYSVIHEGGHAIYEMGCEDRYNHTFLAGGASMGIHESQSRFFENIIGRSEPFLTYIFPKLVQLFPRQLEGVDAHMFWKAVNKASPSLIRTEADELTYCMHIMVRYELEKQLIAGTLAVRDVPEAWNQLYREYLGVEVPNNRMGCLQDSHWSGGSIGYFPSYALGSAYGPQMLAAMEAEMGSIWEDVAKGDLSKVKAWLHNHIHRHARLYSPGTLFEMACGKFDAKYYTDYLTENTRGCITCNGNPSAACPRTDKGFAPGAGHFLINLHKTLIFDRQYSTIWNI